jgi:diacylglycerol kinase family enzyme
VNRARFVRRALLRGAFGAGLASVATVPGRRRWPGILGPAAAAGLGLGAALEDPIVGVALAVGAASVVRASGPVRSPARTAAAVATGGAAGLVTRRVWPLAPRTPVQVRSTHTFLDLPPSEDGSGVTLVVNKSAGSPFDDDAAELLATQLPEARILEIDEGPDLPAALQRAAADARVLGVAGGDGSINAAAAAAHRAGTPLLVIPAGTLNHLARDLGLSSAEDAVTGVREGHAVAVDLGTIDGHPFLNTASVGGYTELVDARERLEGRIGKWPALLVALAGVLRKGQPVRIEMDGRPRAVWMIFVGNGRYAPAGFAPTGRERLDDGSLDVRLVDGSQPWARLRLLLAVVTGRLGRCRAYEAFTTRELRLRPLDGPIRLARDGETFDGSGAFTIAKEERPLSIYVPRPERSPA